MSEKALDKAVAFPYYYTHPKRIDEIEPWW
jgi:hypothetical protein